MPFPSILSRNDECYPIVIGQHSHNYKRFVLIGLLTSSHPETVADICLNPNECNIEEEIKSITNNRGADKVIECAGAETTFEIAWKIARPNAIVALVGLYEKNQILPLPQMYGKNLIFKTGGVDATHSNEILKLISENKINTDFLITQTFKFEDIEKAYNFFETKPEFCLKIAIKY